MLSRPSCSEKESLFDTFFTPFVLAVLVTAFAYQLFFYYAPFIWSWNSRFPILEYMPMARGVEGFHLQFMIGGVTAPAFVSAFSIGYTWVHKPFALGLAGHLVYMYIDVGGGTHAVAAAPGITIGFGG